jgi:hypothetical protein
MMPPTDVSFGAVIGVWEMGGVGVGLTVAAGVGVAAGETCIVVVSFVPIKPLKSPEGSL